MTFDELKEAIDTFKAPDMRDRFAMAALTGLCADPQWNQLADKRIAEAAYALADAMVAEMGDGRTAAAQRDEGES